MVDVAGAGSIEQTIKCTAYGGTVCVVGLLADESNKPVNVMLDLLYGAKTCEWHLLDTVLQ